MPFPSCKCNLSVPFVVLLSCCWACAICRRQVAEHDKLLRALVRKVNAQGRCLSGLVGDAKARRDLDQAARAAKGQDGIAVQCLSCLRPMPDSLPRLREASAQSGGPWAHAAPSPFSAQQQPPHQQQLAQKPLRASSAQQQQQQQRPKSAGRARSSAPLSAQPPPQPEGFGVGGEGDRQPAAGSAAGYVKGLKGDGGAGVHQVMLR
jgi:hypothetical protein